MEEINRAKEKRLEESRNKIEKLRTQYQNSEKSKLEFQMKFQSAEEKISEMGSKMAELRRKMEKQEN